MAPFIHVMFLAMVKAWNQFPFFDANRLLFVVARGSERRGHSNQDVEAAGVMWQEADGCRQSDGMRGAPSFRKGS